MYVADPDVKLYHAYTQKYDLSIMFVCQFFSHVVSREHKVSPGPLVLGELILLTGD
jgi:hypothetical protein